MTSLLGSKRWIAAVMAAGTLVAVSGCTTSGSEDAGTVSPSTGSASAVAPSSAASAVPGGGPSAFPSAEPTAGPTAADTPEPSESAEPAEPVAPSGEPSPAPAVTVPAAGGGICTAAELTGSIEDQLGGGAAGSVYRTLVLTNASSQACTMAGYPGVSFVDAAGNQLGAPADRAEATAGSVTLAPGASATTTLRQTNAQNYGAECGLTPAAGLRVYPPGATDSLILPQDIPACSAASIVLMSVGTLQPAS
ncbi:DUF4232 domain-containing protein [Arthrobacter agilis]|uniref:DUF4232 domain-containing protein n=1 Tax=Arthrobacter agilis TaxID=37921 RepID=UPI000B362ABE|nr:DUF4232 domain-containing protein [Arthrobacter agilis]OUM43698.1 hypothetical protein B8W74_05985 [Arthrobacter agilis]PPB46715.1 DUF4232 domain-containing protein [Arthrobacter agilis]TPV24943.1 DUF4232 domain-containing protein [Arthrobacter agilis]VDR31115.1 Uncharacterised protein [Arthrobacter agilis]